MKVRTEQVDNADQVNLQNILLHRTDGSNSNQNKGDGNEEVRNN